MAAVLTLLIGLLLFCHLKLAHTLVVVNNQWEAEDETHWLMRSQTDVLHPLPPELIILLLLLQETRSSRSRDTRRLSTTRHQDSDSESHLWSVMTKIFPEMMTEITHPQPHGFLTAQPSFRNRFPQFLFIKYRNSQYRLWEWAEAEDYQLFTNYSVFPGIDWWCPWPQPIRVQTWWSVIAAYLLDQSEARIHVTWTLSANQSGALMISDYCILISPHSDCQHLGLPRNVVVVMTCGLNQSEARTTTHWPIRGQHSHWLNQ